MKSRLLLSLGLVCAVAFLSGCPSNDTGPIIPPNGPAASAEDQRTPESDALTSAEASLVNQANSEPEPAPRPDL